MRIIFALDSFKGSLTAFNACRLAADAFHGEQPEEDLQLIPMADGGEGTAAALIEAMQGTWKRAMVCGPLPGKNIGAGYAWFPQRRIAMVEMASASGLTLLKPGEHNPMTATTFGTGELLQLAIEEGAEKILLAVGGSATVDGGTGAAAALGYRFLDKQGKEVGLGGRSLQKIRAIESPRTLNIPPLQVLCDVNNPLVGPEGAAPVYGPQKGADEEMVSQLSEGLENLANVIARDLGKDIAVLPGGGAAGGLAAGAVAFFNGNLVPGFDAVADASGLDQAMSNADWVVTGEGRLDEQSLRGKVVSGVLARAKKHGVNVGVLAGSIMLSPDELASHGIAAAEALKPDEMSLAEAIQRAEELMVAASRALAKKMSRITA